MEIEDYDAIATLGQDARDDPSRHSLTRGEALVLTRIAIVRNCEDHSRADVVHPLFPLSLEVSEVPTTNVVYRTQKKNGLHDSRVRIGVRDQDCRL